ncbi:unnamed protein product [Phytophthora fragariaefolia]|uniref:Unnamed protein product n=1 Tax=Phytophthora fragariaefolia TaxID=1490495 RepID=A0A9W6WN03_9STRA|nr:unnamed protein product [Phytophthora fragariaefolia]
MAKFAQTFLPEGMTIESNKAKWKFLQPWVDALRSRANLAGPTTSASVLSSFDYWSYPQDDFPFAINSLPLSLCFPADEAIRRRDRKLFQKVREALELFTISAAADNSAFVEVCRSSSAKLKSYST